MKVKKGFSLREICGEHIVVAEGKENIDFTNIISMNETSAYLWKEIQDKECFDEKYLANLLTERYDVDNNTALNDARELMSLWSKAEIVEE